MQVILLERIEKLGQMGDVVDVKSGYARNFLLPQKKALRSTPANKQIFDKRRAQLEAQNLERKKEAQAVAKKLDDQDFVALHQAGESGRLYGSVTSRGIAELVTRGGFTVERQQIHLDNPLKSVGIHRVRINLHPEVSVKINLNIARTKEEAERQMKGETTIGEAEPQNEGGIAVEEVFETEDLAKAAEAKLASDDNIDVIEGETPSATNAEDEAQE